MLRGLIVAPHSPFTGEGELNLAVVEAYARHLVAHNVAGAFICGSTGEWAGPGFVDTSIARM